LDRWSSTDDKTFILLLLTSFFLFCILLFGVNYGPVDGITRSYQVAGCRNVFCRGLTEIGAGQLLALSAIIERERTSAVRKRDTLQTIVAKNVEDKTSKLG
jgi:hypothetical protein